MALGPRSMVMDPACRSSLPCNARSQPGEPVIESLDGGIRRCVGANQARAPRLAAIDASTVRTRMERWDPGMIGFSTGKLWQ